MRKVLFSTLFVAATIGVFAQNSKKKETKKTATTTKATKKPAKPTIKTKWSKGGMFSLAVSQGGSRNWAPGGDRFTLAGNSFLNLYANATKGKCHWDNTLDANYGLMNTDKFGTIKNDDKLEFTSKWTHEFGKSRRADSSKRWRYGVTANFRTQFTAGYDYDGDAPKRISDFLAPGIFVLSPGVDYMGIIKGLNLHVSPVAGRWILVPNRPYELAANYGVKPNHEVKNEFGTYVSLNYGREIMKNVYYRSKVDLFSDYISSKPLNIDVYWTNMFYLKVNKYLGVIYNFDLQYDDDTRIFGYGKDRPATQLKSIFGVGLSVRF